MAKHKRHERGHCIRCGERWPCTAKRLRVERAAAAVPTMERGRNQHFALIAAFVAAVKKFGPLDEEDALDHVFVEFPTEVSHRALENALHGAIVTGRVRIDGAGTISLPDPNERTSPTGNGDLEPLRVPLRLVAHTERTR